MYLTPIGLILCIQLSSTDVSQMCHFQSLEVSIAIQATLLYCHTMASPGFPASRGYLPIIEPHSCYQFLYELIFFSVIKISQSKVTFRRKNLFDLWFWAGVRALNGRGGMEAGGQIKTLSDHIFICMQEAESELEVERYYKPSKSIYWYTSSSKRQPPKGSITFL